MVTEIERENENIPESVPAAVEPVEAERPRRPEGAPFEGARGPMGGRGGPGGDDRGRRMGGGRRRRVCIMCADHIKVVDYKNANFLRRFVSDRGRIDTRRKTNACAKHQRALAGAIKRARHLALIPYTAEHIRGASMGHR